MHLYAITGDVIEAQDVTQEAFARAWQRWDQVRRYDNPEAWVRIVGRRLAINRWRRSKNRMAAYSRHGTEAHALPPSEDNVAIVAALRQLPYEQRVAIVLHHLAGLSVVAVARELGIPVGTVKARLWRGRRALAPLLATEDQPAVDALATPAIEDRPAVDTPATPAIEGPENPDVPTPRGGEL